VIKTLGLEYFKIRRKKIWVMITFFIAIELLWAFMSTSMSISRNSEHAIWESIFFSVASMNGLFMPIISAIVVSRICDMEHKGSTWKLLVSTNVSRGRLYAAKYISINSMLLYGILAQTVLMLIIGMIHNFPNGLPTDLLTRFIGGTMLTTMAVTALQQWISMTIKNQAFALCLGMLGGFIGMTAGMFPAMARHLFIWSYYLELSPVTFLYGESSSSYMVQPTNLIMIIAVLLMSLIFYIAGNIHMNRQEI